MRLCILDTYIIHVHTYRIACTCSYLYINVHICTYVTYIFMFFPVTPLPAMISPPPPPSHHIPGTQDPAASPGVPAHRPATPVSTILGRVCTLWRTPNPPETHFKYTRGRGTMTRIIDAHPEGSTLPHPPVGWVGGSMVLCGNGGWGL